MERGVYNAIFNTDSDTDSVHYHYNEHISIYEGRKVREYKERPDYFETLEDNEFLQRFRLSKDTVKMILSLIFVELKSKTERNFAIDPKHKLLLALRFYATGNLLITVGDFIGVSLTSASVIVQQVSQAIAKLKPRFIKMPQSDAEILSTKRGFLNIASFPKVIGVIDCTHVRIQSPGGANAELFRNRKGYFSLNVQVLCNAKLEIINIVCRWPGSAHDSNIFRNSRLRALMETKYKNCFILGDGGYGVSSYMMTPLSNPQSSAEKLYNEAQIRTRNVVERLFGIIKRRFPVLSLGLRIKLDTVFSVIIACAVLHNIARQQNESDPPLDHDEAEDENEGGEAEQGMSTEENMTRSALIREYFDRYNFIRTF